MGPIVNTLLGAVEGSQSKDIDGNQFYQFLGVPYAKKPVGELRFKEPQAAEPWSGVRDATKEGDICYHKDSFTGTLEGSEDCLYLNIFTREVPNDGYNLKPVMVWIHGGAFTGGSNAKAFNGPEFLMTEDVVLVTIKYRLGLLGFLRVHDATLNITGNQGLKDQVEALRWIKNNIQQFNGDPDNVTIFGVSAGATSVHCHILSPLSKNLFHKAIMQSGAVLCPWSDGCDHSVVDIVKIVDGSVKTEREALGVLNGLSVEELYDVQVKFIERIPPGSISPFGPVIEPSTKTNAFLNQRTIDIISTGNYNRVPMIFGYNSLEGILFQEKYKKIGKDKLVSGQFFIPNSVNFQNKDLRQTYVDKLNNFYFKGSNSDINNSMLMSDAWFLSGILGSVKNHSSTSAFPVYLYKMSLDTKLNFVKSLLRSNIPGCSHGDDASYLFKTPITPPLPPDSIENQSLRRMLKLWTNFAKYGNPTPEGGLEGILWKPVMTRQLNTLNIHNNGLSMEINPDGKRMELWRQIYSLCDETAKYM